MENKSSASGNDTEATVHSSDEMSIHSAEEAHDALNFLDADAVIEHIIEVDIERRIMESIDVSIEEILTVLDTSELQTSTIKEKRDAVMVFLKTRVPCPQIQDYYRGPLSPCC